LTAVTVADAARAAVLASGRAMTATVVRALAVRRIGVLSSESKSLGVDVVVRDPGAPDALHERVSHRRRPADVHVAVVEIRDELPQVVG
jgi:hypothetical protein